MIVKGLIIQKLEKVNQDNLLHGRDNAGGDMPAYSTRFRRGGVFYKDYKAASNPFNRGRWDLKHWWNNQFNGLFYKSIKVKVTIKQVTFSSNYDPKTMKGIYNRKPKNEILGMTEQQMIDVQIKNIDYVKPKLLKIINGK